jgi:4-oxalocrotonate tautomerase
MPFIHVHMLYGRTKEQKKALVKAITQAMVEIAKAPSEHTRVVIHDIPPESWGSGGELLSEKER